MNKKYSGTTRSTQPRTAGPDFVVTDPQDAWARFERLVDRVLTPAPLTADKPSFAISKEAQEEAKEIIEKGFRNFADHSQRLADEIADFDSKREEVRKDIKRGARRTSGRII